MEIQVLIPALATFHVINLPLLLLLYGRPCPFVYLYDKVPDLDLCIDAR